MEARIIELEQLYHKQFQLAWLERFCTIISSYIVDIPHEYKF